MIPSPEFKLSSKSVLLQYHIWKSKQILSIQVHEFSQNELNSALEDSSVSCSHYTLLSNRLVLPIFKITALLIYAHTIRFTLQVYINWWFSVYSISAAH